MKNLQEFSFNKCCSKVCFITIAMYLSLAYQACETNDFKSLENLDIHCNATKLAKETRVASQKLGLRLLKIFEKIALVLCFNSIRML
ncbi:MAG: urease accessory UreF family protein [Chitinophagales bacterium]